MKQRLLVVAALSIYFSACVQFSYAQQVKADTGSIAIGGSVVGSTINIGISPDQLAALVRQSADLSEAHKKLIAKLEGDLDLNQRQIRVALEIMGEANVPTEQLASKLVEIAQRIKGLQSIASIDPGDGPHIAALKADARKAIEAGELATADGLLADVERIQKRVLDRFAVNVAETATQRGEIALTRLRYGEAAQHFGNAAALTADTADEDTWIGYLNREADAFFRQGDEFGDNDALRRAIDRYRRLLELRPRERKPVEWALTQTNLGVALGVLGDRETGTGRLKEAIVSFQEALKERTRERVPVEWALTQTYLATALRLLGERESGMERLKEAIGAYNEVLRERTRERAPIDWAKAQFGVGMALVRLGERESGAEWSKQAAAAFREASQELTHERAPMDWAKAQFGLGMALLELGEREGGAARFEEAAAVYRSVLQEMTRERYPLKWASAQNNLGVAYLHLAFNESGTARLEEAVTAYRYSLTEYTRERAPRDWASVKINLGFALRELAEREAGTDRLKEAVTAYGDALNEYARDRVPLDVWTATARAQAVALRTLAERSHDLRTAKQALALVTTLIEAHRNRPTASDFEAELASDRALIKRLRRR